MDLGPVRRVRRLLLREGVASPDDPDEELTERASHLIVTAARVDAEVRGALTADGRGVEITTGRLLRRLAAVADAVSDERSPSGT